MITEHTTRTYSCSICGYIGNLKKNEQPPRVCHACGNVANMFIPESEGWANDVGWAKVKNDRSDITEDELDRIALKALIRSR